MKAHDHLSMHKKENKNFSFLGKQHSKEYKDRMSKMHSGQGNPFYGKHHSKSTKKKISKSGKGRKHSDETKAKISTANKGNTATKYRHWYNDGIKCVMAYDCPEGFKKGRL